LVTFSIAAVAAATVVLDMSVLQHFESYQKARVAFVQAVAEAATRPQNIELMQNAGVMQLLRPLLLDNVSIQAMISCIQCAVQCVMVLVHCGAHNGVGLD
jgi:hypothetical protein